MKKLLSILITITVLISTLTVGTYASAASDEKVSGDFKYKIVDDSAVITEYIGSGKSVTIPSKLDGIKVNETESFLFDNRVKLRKLTIKASLTNLSFGLCRGCTKLEKVVLPKTITVVKNAAFSECKSLKSITFSNKLEEIKNSAFSDSGLTSFRIGKNVKNIDGLIGAKKLSKITLDKNNKKYKLKSGILYNKKLTTLVFYPSAMSRKSFTVPKTVKKIRSSAIYESKNLEKVNLNKVKIIESANFRYSNIKKITIPESVTMIDGGCFSFCSKLKKVVFKTKKPIYIWEYCFLDCKSLSYAEFPKLKCEYCAELMYDDCPALKKIKVLSGVKSVPWLNQGDNNLKQVTIPKSVKKINSDLGYYYYDYTKTKPIKGFTIKGKKNSTAHKYAKKNGFKFIAI